MPQSNADIAVMMRCSADTTAAGTWPLRLNPSVADCRRRKSERAFGCWVPASEPSYGTMGRLRELLD